MTEFHTRMSWKLWAQNSPKSAHHNRLYEVLGIENFKPSKTAVHECQTCSWKRCCLERSFKLECSETGLLLRKVLWSCAKFNSTICFVRSEGKKLPSSPWKTKETNLRVLISKCYCFVGDFWALSKATIFADVELISLNDFHSFTWVNHFDVYHWCQSQKGFKYCRPVGPNQSCCDSL